MPLATQNITMAALKRGQVMLQPANGTLRLPSVSIAKPALCERANKHLLQVHNLNPRFINNMSSASRTAVLAPTRPIRWRFDNPSELGQQALKGTSPSYGRVTAKAYSSTDSRKSVHLSNFEQKVNDAKEGKQLLLDSRRAMQEVFDKFGRYEAETVTSAIDRCLGKFDIGQRAWERLSFQPDNAIVEQDTRDSITGLWRNIGSIKGLFATMKNADFRLYLAHGEWLRCNRPEEFYSSRL